MLRAVSRYSREARRLSTAAEAARVQVTRHPDGVVQVMLSRASKMNALDMPMFRAIQQTARSLIGDKSVRAVVVHGEGRAFCAGLDVKSVCAPLSAKSNMAELLHRPEGEASNLAQSVGYLWRRIPAPVIAATHGVCLGGGFQIAMGADMRIASPRCKFSIMEAKWGIIPDMSSTVTLRERIPRDVAMELTTTGRIFESDEALRLGLLTRIHQDPLDAAMALARRVVKGSPDAAAAAKRLLHATYSDGCTEERALQMESEVQLRLIGGWNQAVCAAKGLGVPPFLTPPFADRESLWLAEADEEVEESLVALLDGTEIKRAAEASTP